MRGLRRPRWAVFISGRGSNLAALLELREDIDIALVVSSNPKAHGLLRAKRAGIPTAITPLEEPRPVAGDSDKPGRAGAKARIDWVRLMERLDANRVTHVFLAGFMRLVPPEFLQHYPSGHILNLHPSLLPTYPGLQSIERAYRDNAAMGATVHEVIEEVDAGRIICQRRSLRPEEIQRYSLARSEFLVHVDEQRIVKETMRRWRI